MKLRVMLLLARILALLWSGFWLFFFVAESVAWHTPLHVMLAWVGVGMLFLLVALAPWRWETTGGFALLAVGLMAAAAYAIRPPPQLPLATRLITTVVFGLPPIVAGSLFLAHHRKSLQAPQ